MRSGSARENPAPAGLIWTPAAGESSRLPEKEGVNMCFYHLSQGLHTEHGFIITDAYVSTVTIPRSGLRFNNNLGS